MKITIDLDEMALAHVAALSQTGLYGCDAEETIQALAMEGLRSAFRAGFVPVAAEIGEAELAEDDAQAIERATGASA